MASRLLLWVPILSCAALVFPALADAEDTLLLRSPTIGEEHVAFVYAGDVWIAGRDGADPRRLTVYPGVEADPALSPDGQWVAFTGHYDGDVDVYVVPVEGGQPQRLTFHPGDDRVRGWLEDQVLFRSSRQNSTYRYGRLYQVPREGGFPQVLPMPAVEHAAFSPDAAKVAYTPFRDAFTTWKRYRGGRTTPVWVFDMQTHETVEIPHVNASDSFPCWVGETVWFLSDRNGSMEVFSWQEGGEAVQVTAHTDHDVRSLSAGAGVLVYEQAGQLHELDPATGESAVIPIVIQADLPHMRPHYEPAVPYISDATVSPTGVRAAFEARGDIFTAPAEHGDIRNLTRTPGVHERSPSWSPDGTKVAYVSDATGEYKLVIRDQGGLEEPQEYSLGTSSFYYRPFWSPDGKKLAYTDKRLNLWVLDLEARHLVKVNTDTFDQPPRSMDPSWSPDSRWIAYAMRLDNHLRAIFLYDTWDDVSHQVTDGMSDATSPTFSRDGQVLYFTASTNFALSAGWLDMSSYERPVRRSVYMVVLDGEASSPLAPRSDEEEAEDEETAAPGKKKKARKKKDDEEQDDEAVVVTVTVEGIDQRILALPIPEGDYRDLQAAGGERLFFLEALDDGTRLMRFDMEERESKPFLEDIHGYEVTADGEKLLWGRMSGEFGIVEAGAEPEAAAGAEPLDLSAMKVFVDPEAEFAQMYDEAWRIFRDYFYDPGMHGVDWPAVKEKYRPWLAHVKHRDDLNVLLGEMMGELVVGHAYRWGGDYPDVERVNVGLLGADFEVDVRHYRIQRIIQGLNWNPDLRSPLTEPGVDVHEGDYLLAVNGQPLVSPTNLHALFANTAGVQTVLTVNDQPIFEGARQVTVVPVADESGLRYRDWVEGNRARVQEATGGRVAYVHLPNTAWAGYTEFNRYYYAQMDREAVILDERFNGGGSVADYIVDMLAREAINMNVTREGDDYASPLGVISGPKVMIVNQDAGSGGDCLPHYFRHKGLGKLVGTRTWGGLIGIYDYPPLIDGGYVTAPRIAFYGVEGEWTAENIGVSPDIEVEMTPKEVIAGRDPQLEKAIEVILEELAANPAPTMKRPAFPDYSKQE